MCAVNVCTQTKSENCGGACVCVRNKQHKQQRHKHKTRMMVCVCVVCTNARITQTNNTKTKRNKRNKHKTNRTMCVCVGVCMGVCVCVFRTFRTNTKADSTQTRPGSARLLRGVPPARGNPQNTHLLVCAGSRPSPP